MFDIGMAERFDSISIDIWDGHVASVHEGKKPFKCNTFVILAFHKIST